MAKRYYNLEKETKRALYEYEKFGIAPVGDVGSLNQIVLKGKALGLYYTTEDVLMLRGLPYFYTNFANQYCFKPTANTGIRNLSDANLNGFIGSPYGSFSDKYRGGVMIPNSIYGTIPFNHYGDNTSFTASIWFIWENGVGAAVSSFLSGDSYLTNGFRSGISPSLSRYTFWSSESGGTVSLNSPMNSIPTSTPRCVTLVYNNSDGFCAIYINGAVSISASGKLIKPRASANSILNLSALLNGTSVKSTVFQISMYYRALSAAEILDNYNITKWRFGL